MLLIIAIIPYVLASIYYNASLDNIPAFVTQNAPLVYLYSEEKYLPGNIAEYVQHFWMSNTSLNITTPLTISSLNSMGEQLRNGTDMDLFLSARDEWKDQPWIENPEGIPLPYSGEVRGCPVTLVVVEREDWVDAFWFYFYPFNEGPYVMGQGPMGNHLGDWEHSLVRFSKDGTPQILWMSAHGGGAAYHWNSVPKENGRPVIYAARGTHANYISQGQHSHDIPWHWLSDFTDRGYLWDPVQNHLAYTFNGSIVHPANGSHVGREEEYGDWVIFDGHWGDPKLDKKDPRQHWAVFNWQMIDGPRGPLQKTLLRDKPCERHKWWNFRGACRIRTHPEPAEGVEAVNYGGPQLLSWVPTKLRYTAHSLTLNSWANYIWELLS